VQVDDFEIPLGKLSDASRRVLDRALDDACRRRHTVLTTDHLFLALSQAEWELFAKTLHDVNVDPHRVLETIEDHLRSVGVSASPRSAVPRLAVDAPMRLALKLALHHATRGGRACIEPIDLFSAAFEDRQSTHAAALRAYGIDADTIVARLKTQATYLQMQEDWMKRRFELPPQLKQFGTNLNLLARQDKIGPVFGRDAEIEQILEILSHRERANSVMLVGEPGVGKTAIVEGLAWRLEFDPDRIPMRLRDSQIVNLQMNSLVAGTMLRGMFEDRIQNVLHELKDRPHLVLFVDEAHTLVGAGSALGAPSDAANIIKSVLGRGELRMIAATTREEYKEHIEQDEALARRFRCVQVPEPDLREARRIVCGVRSRLERNYAVHLSDETIDTALELSPRYMRHLRLPDKVIGWLDTAAVRAEIDGRWEVESKDVVSVISHATRIPEDMIYRDVTDRFRDLNGELQKRVVGQSDAVDAVARRLLLNKGPLKDGFDRPDGVLLFLGPTGVGKTELAKAIAAFLFGDDKRMIRLDMSEYQDPMVGASKLIGMPRGVAGSERGGALTGQLRENPYSVVLLDEVEKATPGVLNLFLQAFDEGWLTDGRGKRAYLSDAIVIMTSNLGAEHFRKLTSPLGFLAQEVSGAQIRGDILRTFERQFSPEFRNRIDEVVLFNPLTRDDVRTIARQYLAALGATLAAAGKAIDVDDAALELLVAQGHSLAYGARFLKRVIDDRVKGPVSARWRDADRFHVRSRDGEVIVEAVPALEAACA
jgi:ATP-dependent Clp protease ATP-binding subunit ClpA